MLQLVHRFPGPIRTEHTIYSARVYGERRTGSGYAGRLLFFPLGGGRVLSTGVETTQSSMAALAHWASALSGTYLEGALARALAAQPEARIAQHLARLERAEAEALSDAVELERAADAARREADSIHRERERVYRTLPV